MNELLKAWYTDSSPGNGANVPSKCGEKFPAIGISGTSTISGPITGVDVTTLGGRALGTPGSTLPSTAVGRAPYWAQLAALASVWFDGHSALYNIPTVSDSGSFSMSFWYNPYTDSGSQLVGPGTHPLVFGSPTTRQTATDPVSGKAMPGNQYFEVCPTSVRPADNQMEAGVVTASAWKLSSYEAGSDFNTDPIDDMQGWCHVMFSMQVVAGSAKVTMWVNDTQMDTNIAEGDTGFPNLPFSSADYTDDQGYDHFWNIGGRPDRLGGGSHNVVVFEWASTGLGDSPGYIPPVGTPISGGGWKRGINVSLGPATGSETYGQHAVAAGYTFTGFSPSWSGAAPDGGDATHGTYDVGCLGFPVLLHNVPSNLSLSTDNCTTVIQGTFEGYIKDAYLGNKGFRPAAGEGLQGGVTELWIAPGQFIDWSVLANRYKFHTSDDPSGVSPSHWAPVDIGSDGKTPTGTKPLIYLTGPPALFNLNRARSGKSLNLFRNTTGGLVGQLLAYFKVPL